MISSQEARPVVGSPRPLPSAAPSVAPTTGLTVYGCGADEAAAFRATAPRFGVLPTTTELPLSAATVELARGNRCISVDHRTRVPNSVLRALGDVGVAYISARSVGVDHIDVACARSVGVAVGTVGYSPDSVADYTLMLILMIARNAVSVLRRGDALDYRVQGERGRELRDLTVGVVGTGRIGSAVVDRLRGFGCRVLTHDKRPTTPGGCTRLDDVLRFSDVVTLHTPLDADTHHLLDRRRIALMKSGALVVNTGRGALLDTEALVAALESGRLGGAALDVLEGEDRIFYADRGNEPLENELLARLHRLPNVVLTPHVAYRTDHALRDTVENTLRNCVAFEQEVPAWIG